MTDKNSNIPALNALFGMSIFLFIIIFLIHKDISETRLKRRNGWIQTILDKYFNNKNKTG